MEGAVSYLGPIFEKLRLDLRQGMHSYLILRNLSAL